MCCTRFFFSKCEITPHARARRRERRATTVVCRRVNRTCKYIPLSGELTSLDVSHVARRVDQVRSNATPSTIIVSFAHSRAGIAFSDRSFQAVCTIFAVSLGTQPTRGRTGPPSTTIHDHVFASGQSREISRTLPVGISHPWLYQYLNVNENLLMVVIYGTVKVKVKVRK